jgi:hypothetical protein
MYDEDSAQGIWLEVAGGSQQQAVAGGVTSGQSTSLLACG